MRTALLLALSCASLCASQAIETAILAKMDQAGPAFSGMTANMARTTYTAVIKESDKESGTIRLKRIGPKEVQVLIDFTEPDRKMVAFHGSKAQVYYPKIKTVEEYQVGKEERGLVDEFLRLGFGSTGKELKQSYTINSAVKDIVAGRQTTLLSLVPKTAKVKEKFPELDLWVSDETGEPVQQKLVEPSGNYYLIGYTDMKLNPVFAAGDLEMKLPKDVVRRYPQK
jgi:outer membrane lipoprotein-sorting protein